MGREEVVYGSKVGNTTNPQFLEIDSWVKYTFHYISRKLYIEYGMKIRLLLYSKNLIDKLFYCWTTSYIFQMIRI